MMFLNLKPPQSLHLPSQPQLPQRGEGDALVRPEWTKPLASLGNVEYLTLKGFNHHPFATIAYQVAVDEMVLRIGRR